MKSIDYWEECISIAADEIGLKLSKEQLDHLSDSVKGAHENYSMFFGYDVASSNLTAERNRELESLKEALKKEKSKRQCKNCEGTGHITTYGGTFQSTSSCYKCNGEGRHL